jgi:hypothetical protein
MHELQSRQRRMWHQCTNQKQPFSAGAHNLLSNTVILVHVLGIRAYGLNNPHTFCYTTKKKLSDEILLAQLQI